jgi:hypothetical protein
MAYCQAFLFELIGFDILVSEGNFRTEKHDEPSGLHPDKKEGRAANLRKSHCIGNADLQTDVEELKIW